MRTDRLTVIIVNWNTKELLEGCLSALYANTAGDLLREVIVVDNGSIDGSSGLVREKFPMVRLILNEDNLGFAVASNKALRIAGGDYVLFLNTDVILKKGAIEKLIGFMDNHPDCGLCTPSLIRQDGSRQESYISFPTIITELFGRLPQREKKEPCKVQSIRGACMLARRNVINSLGGFNEKYFLFLEETDLCLRLYKNGYTVWYVPSVEVCHTGGGSAERDKVGARIEYWRSRYIFFKENYSNFQYALLNFGLSVKLILDLVLNIFGNRSRLYLTLFLWHILGKPGDWGIGPMCKPEEFQLEGGILIKENKSRKLVLYNDKIVKIYKKRTIFKRPWLREWRMINRIRQLDIPTVRPIAYGEGYLVTKKIEGVKILHEFVLQDIKDISFKERLVLTHSLAEFVKKLHTKGICHGDLHAGNILIGKDGDGYRFYITDLHRARIKINLSKGDIINNLIQLDNFFSMNVSSSERLLFFKYYVSGTSMEGDYKRYARIISVKTEDARYRLWRKRDRLYLKKDKYGIKGRYQGIDYILNPAYRDIDIAEIFKYIIPLTLTLSDPRHAWVRGTHAQAWVWRGKGEGAILKDSRSSYLSRFDIPGIGDVVVKINRQKRSINYIKDIFRNSRGFRAWRASWALITRGIQTPEPILAGELRRFRILKSSFIIVRNIPNGEDLTLFVRDKSEGFKDVLTDKLSYYMKTLHNRGIFHPDTKGSNIIVQGEDSDINFYLVDLDHIKIKRKVLLNKRLYSIRQIKRSTGLFPARALPIRRILIIKPSSLGDIVQALPVASVIRKEYPGASIWWLANSGYVELLRLVPSIDKTISFERERWGDWRNLWKTIFEFSRFLIGIRKLHIDLVLDLQGLFRSGLITWISGASIRIGFGQARPVRDRASNGARECSSLFYTDRIYPNKLHAQERYIAMARYVARPSTGHERLNIPTEKIDWAEGVLGDRSKIRIVINPGARWYTKRWDSSRYTELIDELGKRYDVKIILVGDKDDIPVSEDILRRAKSSIINLTGRTTLTELVAILNGCSVLVTNDSGPMHLANYMGKPIVAIFGPTDPGRTGPIGGKDKILKADIPCSPCFKRYCKNFICMKEISVKDVLAAVEDVLQKQGAVV